MANVHEQMNCLADRLCGYREASFGEMMDAVDRLKNSESILIISQNAMARRQAIKEAADQLMIEIEALSEF